MKKSIIPVIAGLLSAVSASYADLTSVTLTSSNASNASVDTYYKWVPADTANTLATNAAITFSESNLALLANRAARDWSGSITLAADTSGNYVKVGSTAATNVLGFSNATITGENTNTFLTFTTYSDATYNAGYYRIVTTGTALTINAATVTFTDANMALTAGATSTIVVNGGGTLVWNIGALWNSSLVADSSLGLTFSSGTKGDGNIVLGASAGMNNYGFSNVNVSFADGIGSTVNFTGNKASSLTNSTFNIGARTVSFTNSGAYTLSGSSFVGTDKSTSTVTATGSSVTATSLTASNATVNLTSSSTTATVNGLTLDNATVNINAATTATLGTFTGTGTSASTSIVNVTGTSGISGGTFNLNNITVNLNSALASGSLLSLTGTNGGNLVINVDSSLGGSATQNSIGGPSSGSTTLTIASGVSLTAAARASANFVNFDLKSNSTVSLGGYNIATTSGNNILRTLTMASGSTFTVAGGMRIGGTGSVVNGTINVNGSGRTGVLFNSDEFIFGITGGVTFGASAIVNQAYQSVGATNWITGSMIVNSATGSLRFGNVMNFGKSSTTTLNTTDAIISGSGDLGATSQATSTFKLTSYTATGNGAKFIVNAPNNVGSFDLAQSGNPLYLEFGESGSLTVGEDAGLTSFTGAYLGTDTIVLVGDILNKLKVYDLTESQIQDYFASSTGNTIYTVAVGDGSYWVNTVVPEPAEWAAIFGALALGLAIYRKRSK